MARLPAWHLPTWFPDPWQLRRPVTPPATPRPLDMESADPLARVREQRRTALVSELLPKLRRLNPLWSDDEILETAESIAELRLLDEEIG